MIFREGDAGRLEFIGDFDTLYREDDDPWGQSGQRMSEYYALSRQQLIEELSRHKIHRCLEAGCGHGYLTKQLVEELGFDVLGIDVSETAIDQARQLHPQLCFEVANIISSSFKFGRFDCVILAQAWWYILHEVDKAIKNLTSCLPDGGILIITQAFLKDHQRYGTDIAQGFAGAIQLMGRFKYLKMIDARLTQSSPHNDGILVFKKVPYDAVHR